MTTGQFPKRRESDSQAKRRVESIQARRREREGGARGGQVFRLLDELVRAARSQVHRDAFK